MLAGAAMASAPRFAPRPPVPEPAPASEGAGSRAGPIPPSARRPALARRPSPSARAGLDWENDDFVPASKANKKKKTKGGNAAQAQKQNETGGAQG